ncbi:aldo/keto reductase, partial [Streptomyces sp. NPDC000927]|uniref:aldo/keto reductase n=1 Tax=Streptomyces sp. NPDC000927 TaxID=3154371 RepID=UPI00331DC14C
MSPVSHPLDDVFLLGGESPVRRLGYGTAQLTGPGYWGPRGERREAVAVLRAAVGQGVTLVDTADNYGPGLAEELVAEALRPYPDELMVATKGGVVRTSDRAWHVDGRPERLRAMCEASLRRLRTERIGLYQLHRLDPQVPMADQLGALDELRQEGNGLVHDCQRRRGVWDLRLRRCRQSPTLRVDSLLRLGFEGPR